MPEDTTLRPFSALQYYLAHAQNRVHLMIGVPRAVSTAELLDLVAEVVAAAPQLRWRESLVQGGHSPDPDTRIEALIDHQGAVTAAAGRAALVDCLSQPLHDTGKPAFRVVCRSAPEPDPDGVQCWILFQTTHALMEGGDIASILRGRGSVHDARRVVDGGLGVFKRLAAAVLPAFFYGLHMLAAATEKRDPAGFAFLTETLDRADLCVVARRLGVSQRALVFGLVTHALLAEAGKKRSVSLTYSTLPTERARLSDDEFLNLRMDDLRLRLGADVEADIRTTANALDARGPSPIFAQTWQRKLTRWHRSVHQRCPGLYPRRFFGFAPYDMVLSMVPPVDPGRFSPLLTRARVFAGSNTGSVPTCVMVPTRETVSLTLWASPVMQARFDRLRMAAETLGIRCGCATVST